jgi:hypothetical protein
MDMTQAINHTYWFRAIRILAGLLTVLAVSLWTMGAAVPGKIEKGNFRFTYDERGISGLANPKDPFGATVMPLVGAGGGGRSQAGATSRAGRAGTPPVLSLILSYRTDDKGAWASLSTRGLSWDASPENGTVTYSNRDSGAPIRVVETFKTDGKVLDWTIDMESAGNSSVQIGDLGITVPAVGPSGENPIQIFERGFLRHQFIEGNGSFFYFVRASGAPPFLLVTVRPGTKLEYFGGGGGRSTTQVYIHSAATGGSETRGTWRQKHTALDLAPAGRPGSRATYGFRLQWAASYEEMREMVYQVGLFDIRVVPGMTLPENLTARFSLHTKAKIDSIQPEFPGETRIATIGEPLPDCHVYEVAFRKLGENMLTINHDGGRKTYLEFFVTEPMETLIKKRAAFIVNKQQIKDPTKWWDGVYGPYDMRAKVTRTIDDPDIFLDRMVYVLTCDDPGLCKAPYIASKNVTFPDPKEIRSLEYYLERFVWGGLQRKDDERPYPYGIYGTPNWYINRDPARRKAYAESLASGETALRDLNKEHVWRSYDYPHVVMLYFHMYQIAKMYPEMSKYLDAAGYLERAWETARAFYTYPYEIYPTYYETYKWGLYNELIVLDLIEALESEGFPNQAEWLRNEWEKKTKYFVYDDLYPFRSEYAFDRTAFESTYALAKYGATHDMKSDENLWFDLKNKKGYSHPLVRREDSRAFMDRQLASGLVVRGWLEASFYQLGCDSGVSYMAAMGGWGILDYGLNFAAKPWDWLELGYASYLSSWCLMNSGRPETDYGFWYPGPENDGASGWQFQSAKVGGAWMGSSYPGGVQVPRGPWWYDGEIDLGYGGALRMASTVVTRDPIFGWFACGGAMTEQGNVLSINPRDGLRRRLYVVIPDIYLPFEDDIRRLKLELERDGFAADGMIVMDKALDKISFTIENRTTNAHKTGVRLSIPVHSRYELLQDGKNVPLVQTGNWDYPWRAELTLSGPASKVELVRTDRREVSGK